MPYAIRFADTAAEDLARLVNTFPVTSREQIIDEVGRQCVAFAQKPKFRPNRFAKPSFSLQFKIDDTYYWWAATFLITNDETTIEITHIWRRRL